MLKIAEEMEAKKIEKVRLIHFPSKGSYLRGGNAKGIFDYISKRRIEVEEIEKIAKEDIPEVNYPTVYYTGDASNPFRIEQ